MINCIKNAIEKSKGKMEMIPTNSQLKDNHLKTLIVMSQVKNDNVSVTSNEDAFEYVIE